jgi:hypothetical protein
MPYVSISPLPGHSHAVGGARDPGGLLRPHTSTELAKIPGVARSAVSRAVLAQENVGLVEYRTPDETMDRLGRPIPGKKFQRLLRGWGNSFSNDFL